MKDPRELTRKWKRGEVMWRSMARTIAVLPVLLALTACDESSPTEPEPPGPPPAAANIVFADPQTLDPYRPAIIDLIQTTAARSEAVLPVGGVQVTVFDDPPRAIPGWGIGGYAVGAAQIEIVVDSGFRNLADILPERLPQVVAHELHHIARFRGPGYGGTLLEAMISEGLADHFAIELTGSPEPPWVEAFPESQTDVYLDRARLEFDSASYNFNAWFFGFGMDLPRWTGYTLGYRLVRDYMSEHPGSTAASLVNTPAEVFRPE